MGTDPERPGMSGAERRSRLFKLLRRGLSGLEGMRTKHGASLALDILEANGIREIALPRADGRLIHISTRDKVIASEIVRLGSFARDNMRAFSALLTGSGRNPAALTFVNIGANIGTTCLNAYDEGFRRIVAVEPEPENFRLLERNLAGLSGAAVRCHQLAIGDSKGHATLHRHGTNLGSHSLLSSGRGQDGRNVVEVGVETLSAVLTPGERFVLFVDVEGFEPQVLRGGASEIAAACEAMALEITPGRYAAADAADLAQRIAAFANRMTVLPSGPERPSAELPALMATHTRGHFDVALVREAVTAPA